MTIVVHYKTKAPAVCQASRKDTLDFLSVAVDASRNGQQQRLAAARWAARMQDRMRLIQAFNH